LAELLFWRCALCAYPFYVSGGIAVWQARRFSFSMKTVVCHFLSPRASRRWLAVGPTEGRCSTLPVITVGMLAAFPDFVWERQSVLAFSSPTLHADEMPHGGQVCFSGVAQEPFFLSTPVPHFSHSVRAVPHLWHSFD